MSRYAQITGVARVTEDGAHVVNITCDPGGGDLIEAEWCPSPGDDSLPMIGDFVCLHEVEGETREQAVGVADPKNKGVAKSGEVRLYARKADGSPVAHIYAKNDGSIVIESLSDDASITVHATGTLNLTSDANDIRLGPGGNQIATVGSVVTASLDVASAASAIFAPSPSGSLTVAGQVVTGIPSASGG